MGRIPSWSVLSVLTVAVLTGAFCVWWVPTARASRAKSEGALKEELAVTERRIAELRKVLGPMADAPNIDDTVAKRRAAFASRRASHAAEVALVEDLLALVPANMTIAAFRPEPAP